MIQVALGSAHVVAISDKGEVYTFGMSHKGQCGLEKPDGKFLYYFYTSMQISPIRLL